MRGGSPYGLVDNGAVLVTDGQIAWVGAMRDAPRADRQIDAEGRLLHPRADRLS